MRVSPWLIDQSNDRERPTDPPVRCPFPASLTPPTYQDRCTGVTDPPRLGKTPTVPPASIVLIIMSGVLCRTICQVRHHHSCLQVHHSSVIDECILVILYVNNVHLCVSYCFFVICSACVAGNRFHLLRLLQLYYYKKLIAHLFFWLLILCLRARIIYCCT